MLLKTELLFGALQMGKQTDLFSKMLTHAIAFRRENWGGLRNHGSVSVLVNPLESRAHSFWHISANLVIMEGMLYYPIPQEKHTLTLVLNLMRHFSFHSLLALLWLGYWEFVWTAALNADHLEQFDQHADEVHNCRLLWKQRDKCIKNCMPTEYLLHYCTDTECSGPTCIVIRGTSGYRFIFQCNILVAIRPSHHGSSWPAGCPWAWWSLSWHGWRTGWCPQRDPPGKPH